MKRKNVIIISIAGITLVLLCLLGFTYGYFMTVINGNTSAKSIDVTTSIKGLEIADLTLEDIKGKKRNANITMPRQIAMYICRNVLNEPLMKIGIEFGGKDHTTVMHAVRKVEELIVEDTSLSENVEALRRLLEI